MEIEGKKVIDLGCALYFLCVSPSGYLNNDNGVRPYW